MILGFAFNGTRFVGEAAFSVGGAPLKRRAALAVLGLAVAAPPHDIGSISSVGQVALAAGSTYTSADALAFIGGYTVSGQAIEASLRKSGLVKSNVYSFSLDQECLCSCNATAVGIFCLGANPGNAFTAVARKEGGNWIMEQQSINGDVGGFNYHATFDFGATAGGPRSVTGFSLEGPGAVTSTQFQASQSASGCNMGVGGASVCLSLCTKYDISTAQLVSKCGI